MYKEIDFPSPLLFFLALFRSLSLSCSLLLSRSLSGGGGGYYGQSGGGGSGYTDGSVTIVDTQLGGSNGDSKVVIRLAV